jgi:hypothetical protein
METVFVEQPKPQINAGGLPEAAVLKQKRSAFVFITAESDESNNVLEDLGSLMQLKRFILQEAPMI